MKPTHYPLILPPQRPPPPPPVLSQAQRREKARLLQDIQLLIRRVDAEPSIWVKANFLRELKALEKMVQKAEYNPSVNRHDYDSIIGLLTQALAMDPLSNTLKNAKTEFERQKLRYQMESDLARRQAQAMGPPPPPPVIDIHRHRSTPSSIGSGAPSNRSVAQYHSSGSSYQSIDTASSSSGPLGLSNPSPATLQLQPYVHLPPPAGEHPPQGHGHAEGYLTQPGGYSQYPGGQVYPQQPGGYGYAPPNTQMPGAGGMPSYYDNTQPGSSTGAGSYYPQSQGSHQVSGS